MPKKPSVTLEEIRNWPAAVNVDDAARALGISRAAAYEAIRTDTFPARTVKVGTRVKVVTASILKLVEA